MKTKKQLRERVAELEAEFAALEQAATLALLEQARGFAAHDRELHERIRELEGPRDPFGGPGGGAYL